jgi:hypothetical protein
LLGAVLLTKFNKMNITLKRNYGYELIFEAEKKLENIRRKNLNQNTNKQK